ncbi:hypothetical protein TNIN_306611 [Trichonephila inaurata madagascariensis]|uniref:Uncharacterized protein n=1 Tax=Trichonephila inaurata madagascariensis TaxID=2747483 RepID=A0A8X6XY52_9ARAC|nr:hypothetical protein TNIN_306611 [Trichonephila inaurata madagascariensis]
MFRSIHSWHGHNSGMDIFEDDGSYISKNSRAVGEKLEEQSNARATRRRNESLQQIVKIVIPGIPERLRIPQNFPFLVSAISSSKCSTFMEKCILLLEGFTHTYTQLSLNV